MTNFLWSCKYLNTIIICRKVRFFLFLIHIIHINWNDSPNKLTVTACITESVPFYALNLKLFFQNWLSRRCVCVCVCRTLVVGNQTLEIIHAHTQRNITLIISRDLNVIWRLFMTWLINFHLNYSTFTFFFLFFLLVEDQLSHFSGIESRSMHVTYLFQN